MACAKVNWAMFSNCLCVCKDSRIHDSGYVQLFNKVFAPGGMFSIQAAPQVSEMDLMSDLYHHWAQVWLLECGVFLVPDKRVT